MPVTAPHVLYCDHMRWMLVAAAATIGSAVATSAAHADSLRWLPAQIDADARILADTNEAQLLVSAGYLRVWGTPYARANGRAAGLRVALGVSGELGGVTSNRCKLGVDCFVGRVGPTVHVGWSGGDVRGSKVHSDRALFGKLTPHAGWIAAGNGLGSLEAGATGAVGVAFAVSGQETSAVNESTTIVTIQALGTFERGGVFLGVALGISLR